MDPTDSTDHHGARDRAEVDLDSELMDAFRRGDEQAFVALVERNRRRAVSIAARFLGDREEAEDLAQEAFVRVYRARSSFRPQAGFATWFYRLLTNLCLTEARRRRRAARHTQTPAPGGEDPPAAPSSAESVEQQDLQERVRQALLGLPAQQRLATVLHRYEGLSYRQIAQVLGCSPGAVDGLLSRAKQTLRAELSDQLSED